MKQKKRNFNKQNKMFNFLKSTDVKTICQNLKTNADKQCQKVKQRQGRTYFQRFNQSHREHEKMLLYIKILILLGMIIMAGVFHYTDFIKEHGDLFGLEVLTYSSCALAAYIFTCFLRNQNFKSLDFFIGAGKWVVFSAIVVILAELAGMNTKFMHESHHSKTLGPSLTPKNEYRERGLKFKKELWGKMILGINLAFLVGLSLLHLKENDRGSFILLVLGVVAAFISIWIPQIKEIHTKLREQEWLVGSGDVSDSEIGMTLFYSGIFIVFAIIVLFTSLFRYETFKIYSYFPDNPKMCGLKRAVSTIFVFLFESLIVAAMCSVPILYVSSNRNKPELGDEYKIAKDKEAFVDFAMLTSKIFVFWVALQMTGLFDSYNKGFCRVKETGCNIRLPQGAKQCALKPKQTQGTIY
jgi:hypothetical protein